MMPPQVADIRRELCNCKDVKHDDPCAACPRGHFGIYSTIGCGDGEKRIGLGDRIASVATPIARFLGLPCVDEKTKELKPESPCGQAKKRFNAGEPIIPTIIKRIRRK